MPTEPGHEAGRPKALLEVAGAPMIRRVTEALVSAGVDRVLVSHDPGVDLADALRGLDRVERIPRPVACGLADGLYHDFLALVRQMPAEDLARATVLLVPADLAMASAADFAGLLAAFERVDADAAVLVLDLERLPTGMKTRRLPVLRLGRPPRSVVLQGLFATKGRLYRETDGRLDCVDWGPAETARMVELVRFARSSRKQPFFVLRLIRALTARRLRSVGTVFRAAGVALDYLRGRLSTDRVLGLAREMYGVDVAVLRSDWPAFSADLDDAGDVERLFRAPGPSVQPVEEL